MLTLRYHTLHLKQQVLTLPHYMLNNVTTLHVKQQVLTLPHYMLNNRY